MPKETLKLDDVIALGGGKEDYDMLKDLDKETKKTEVEDFNVGIPFIGCIYRPMLDVRPVTYHFRMSVWQPWHVIRKRIFRQLTARLGIFLLFFLTCTPKLYMCTTCFCACVHVRK